MTNYTDTVQVAAAPGVYLLTGPLLAAAGATGTLLVCACVIAVAGLAPLLLRSVRCVRLVGDPDAVLSRPC
ncbi:hypothetical protein ACFQU9_18835 [Actinomadura namibiensis]|uniref:hypothetical protein n=1 Tax=Actinomadura kijaniata TaxID=46161 RepID=UPI003616E625